MSLASLNSISSSLAVSLYVRFFYSATLLFIVERRTDARQKNIFSSSAVGKNSSFLHFCAPPSPRCGQQKGPSAGIFGIYQHLTFFCFAACSGAQPELTKQGGGSGWHRIYIQTARNKFHPSLIGIIGTHAACSCFGRNDLSIM